jgi:hypothetical protein
MRLRLLILACAGLALTVGVATASAGGGNSDNANLCKKGGWQNLVRADGTPFGNQGDCVSYAARGGTPRAPTTADLCMSFGGTYSTDPATEGTDAPFSSVVWTCNGVAIVGAQFQALATACFADGGHSYLSRPDIQRSTCGT